MSQLSDEEEEEEPPPAPPEGEGEPERAPKRRKSSSHHRRLSSVQVLNRGDIVMTSQGMMRTRTDPFPMRASLSTSSHSTTPQCFLPSSSTPTNTSHRPYPLNQPLFHFPQQRSGNCKSGKKSKWRRGSYLWGRIGRW